MAEAVLVFVCLAPALLLSPKHFKVFTGTMWEQSRALRGPTGTAWEGTQKQEGIKTRKLDLGCKVQAPLQQVAMQRRPRHLLGMRLPKPPV